MENTTKNDRLRAFIISDSVGDTAAAMVEAAFSQFEEMSTELEWLTKVTSADQVREFLEPFSPLARRARVDGGGSADDSDALKTPQVVFYTLTDPAMREEVSDCIKRLGLPAVDLLSSAIDAIARATGLHPLFRAGVNRKLDKAYFKRIDAMDYAVDHDDGRLPEEYSEADIVLMGVSRTSKTPLSMYLASHGYKVANLPLAPGMNPPKQIFDVEPWRIFGLISSVEVLAEIRTRRLGPEGSKVAAEYASREYIERDLAEARALMRKLGCIVVRTDNRAIEETAREILFYYEPALELHNNR